jgi:hypothetical protein
MTEDFITNERKAVPRLAALVNLLRTIPPARFDLSGWAQEVEKSKEVPCGTTACAVGYAVLHPHFKNLGLKLNADFSGDCRLEGKMEDANSTDNAPDVEEAFGIDGNAVAFFFDSFSYPKESETTPKEVAERIERHMIWQIGLEKWQKAIKAHRHVKYKQPTIKELQKAGLHLPDDALNR